MASHYVLTYGRRVTIEDLLMAVLARRPKLIMASWSVSAAELQRWRWTEDELDTLVRADAITDGCVTRINTFLLRVPGGLVSMLTLKPIWWCNTAKVATHLFYRGNGLCLDGRSYAHGQGYQDVPRAVAPEDFVGSDERADINRRICEWAEAMKIAAARHEIGRRLVSKMLDNSRLLTNIEATLPDVRSLLVEHPQLTALMDKAPPRTLRNYRVEGMTDTEIEALRTLMAEGFVLPPLDPKTGQNAAAAEPSAFVADYCLI